jgi:hypothetical protein
MGKILEPVDAEFLHMFPNEKRLVNRMASPSHFSASRLSDLRVIALEKTDFILLHLHGKAL